MKNCFTIFFAVLFLTRVGYAQSVTYTESTAEIQNPDRGFYTPIDGIASSFTPLTATQLANLRNNPFTPWQGNYTVSPTIIFRHYVLDIFKSSSLSTSFLNGVQADFTAARTAGVRLLIRFSYTITAPTGSCGSWICPPYGDAPKAIILGHIAQLKPYLQNNSDVILAVQNGFIGVWGEQYYTDYFGDASVQGKLTDQNWQDRLDVLTALLDAVPSNRMVQVRYPQYKQKFVYGINAPVTSAAMTSAQAYNGTSMSRIGFHNDCFLSATDDQGTYWDYGTSSTSASDQTTILKAYAANDGKYGAVGGETCSDTFSPQNDCGGQAVSDMDLLNYSFLNSDYENAVNSDWQSGGCMDQIKRSFGYRFVMRNGTFPATATSGGTLTFSLAVDNVGFTAPFNSRVLKLVLRNTSSSQVYSVDITGTNADTRFWLPGQTINLSKTVTLPSGIPNGTYDLLLHVSDVSNNNAVATRPEYSIQFANTGTWESTTGYNKLNSTVTISATTTAPLAPTNLTASAASSSQINLSWSASSGAASYSVLRSATSGGTFTQIASGLTGTTYSNSGLTASTTYYYTVKATNAVGTSPASNQASATTSSGGGSTTIVADGNASEWSAIAAITTNGTGGIASLKAANSATYLYILAQGTSISTNYQLFIDTDNNATGTNEYTASSWPSTGFNFMIENGTLYQYAGTGANWTWTSLGTITAVKNTTVLEARVPLSQLGTLATTIRIAVASINSSWTTIGYVPASGGSGAAYTVGSTPAARASTVSEITSDVETQNEETFLVYPNPARSVLHVQYTINREGLVHLDLFDILGKKIHTVDSAMKHAGVNEATMDVNGLRGYYIIRLKTSVRTQTQLVRID